jgi:hypothetical protein
LRFNCTIVGNAAEGANAEGGGVYCSQGSVQGCVVYYNSATNEGTENWAGDSNGIVHSCTWPAIEGNGNVAGPPQFKDLEAGDYRLSGVSPCIDGGENMAWMDGARDMAGMPRVFGPAVDMGAYEFTMTTESRFLLQGPYATNTHRLTTHLPNGGLIPTDCPYAAHRTRAEPTVSNAVDWVQMELLRTNDHGAVCIRSALLREDGVVLSENGAGGIRLEASPGQYYLVARHRNHLAAVSAAPVAYTNETVTYDFTTGPEKYMGGTNACVELEPGVWGMIAGDADGDGRITPVDREIVRQQRGKTGYLSGDLNLDGVVTTDEGP